MIEPAKRILVVDDDASLRELLAEYLGAQGFAVSAAADAAEMDARLAAETVDLILMDVMLPGEDGLSAARRVNARRIPIIMLSARGEEIDRIVGLEVGADDYLPKPFSPRELLARIRAVLRRGAGAQAEPQRELVRFGRFAFDLAAQQLSRDGREVPLTAGEFNLLKVFVEHPNRVLSRDQLMDLLKGYERTPFDRSIDVRVTRLRRKIEDDPAAPVFVRTVWGEGYLFAPQGRPG